jgi:SAM-dependent methyltransferase
MDQSETNINASTAPSVRSPFDDALLYDILFGDLEYDRNFYMELARLAAGPVLEVACGTGRILFPCLQAGTDIDGLDLSGPMLDILRRKTESLRLHPRLYQADMRDFTLPRRYRLIFIAFNGFVHNLTSEDQLSCLRVCRDHLLPGGSLVFNTFFPGTKFLNGPEGTPVLEHEAINPATGLPVRIYDTRTLNRVEQVQYSQIEIQELDAEGRITAAHRSQTEMRWTYKIEMELLLRAAGFQRWQICGSFDRRPLTHDTDIMVVFAWREG